MKIHVDGAGVLIEMEERVFVILEMFMSMSDTLDVIIWISEPKKTPRNATHLPRNCSQS